MDLVNFSSLNVGREMSDKRDSGAQVILGYDHKLTKKFDIIIEYFGNTIDEKQTRGIYLFGVLSYKINKRRRCQFG